MRYLAPAAALACCLAWPVSAQQPALVQAGRDLYEARECDRCHMVAGKGYKAGKLDGVAKKVSADQMRQWLTEPKTMEAKLDTKPKVRMSSRKGMTFTETELTAMIAYLGTLR